MKQYNLKLVESKWQKKWEQLGLYKARDFLPRAKSRGGKGKMYILIEFPYPSGEGLHVGHVRSYSALDAVARKKRMEGYNVLYPIGYDAFGLPTENYAIKTGIHPIKVTKKNIRIFIRQLKNLGLSFDWSREINTTDPEYYKWTQWIFLKMFEKGLAYQAEMPINWCPSCKIGLANEEVVGGKCERCGAETERREQKQWMLKITAYAERLLKDLEKVDYSARIKTQQINWIGRSEGATVKFKIGADFIEVFTTRIDTIFGVTALVLSPEHPIIKNLESGIKNQEEVKRYVEQARRKSELERTDLEKEKTGVPLRGIFAINPLNNEKIPVWVGDYVIATYGGGAVMVVPAHDKRDYGFAKKYGLEIREVINKPTIQKGTILIIHGFGGNSKESWFPWFKKEFENRGYKVIIPDLPNTDAPVLEDWISALQSLKKDFEGNLIIIGHSLGAITACKFIDQANIKVKKLILIGPTGKSGRNWENLKKFDFDDDDVNVIKKFNSTEINWEKLRGLIGKSIIYFSKDDPYISLSVQEDYKELRGQIRIFENKGHFCENQGKVTELPEIISDIEEMGEAYVDYGTLVNSGQFNGLKSEEAIKKITDWLVKNKLGGKAINYKLRDWVFSRQHYWGEPIPIIYCQKCGIVAVPEKDLPVKLPYVKKYKPTNTGESPLAAIKEWVNTKCPECKGPAKRETDTMPNWAGSNWYYLAYLMRGISNFQFPISKYKKVFKYWMPVDLYNGGMEHTTLHLLYSRFIYKFLYDIQAVPTIEPYAKRRSHGMVLASDGRKMSKSFGNVINPDEVVKKYGADSLRLYEMFMGPFEEAINWSAEGLEGCYRFLKRVWTLFQAETKLGKATSKCLVQRLHYTIKKISDDLEVMKFNTVVSTMMGFTNLWSEKDNILSKKDAENFLKILAPFAPHIAEELWFELDHKKSIFTEKWPKYDEKLIKKETFELVIQVNGKVRDKVEVDVEISQQEAKKIVLEREKIKNWIKNEKPKKIIFVKGKLINIVI